MGDTVALVAIAGIGVGIAAAYVFTWHTRAAGAANEERARLVEQLSAVVRGLNSNLDLDDVLRRIARSATELVGADAGAFVRTDRDGSTLVAAHGLPNDVLGFHIGPGEGVMRDVTENRRPIVIADYQTDPHRVPEIAGRVPNLHTMVAVPCVVDDDICGALFAMFATPGRRVTDAEVDVLSLLAGHAGTAVSNASAFASVVTREAHEQAVIEALADGVAVVDADGLVTSWNSSAAAMTGIPEADAVGRPLRVPVGAAGEPVEHAISEERWIEVIATPLPETGEQVLVLRDVSARKSLERAQNLFLATTTHEIKTPLTVVNGFATTLFRRWESLSQQDRERALSAIMRRSDALVRLIDQLLLGFRAQAGQLEVDLRALELEATIEAAATGFETVSDVHDVVVDLPDNLPLVIADARAIDQVLGQLVENAIKYSPEGGRIHITAEVRDDVVAIRVIDDGLGIEPGDEERIFNRYYRANSNERRGIKGVGLGLYIVRQLVEAMGGSVRARRNDGAPGSTFEFTLPAAMPDGVIDLSGSSLTPGR